MTSVFAQYKNLRKILKNLGDARVVGGGVRNPLFGMPVNGEIDIASPYSPQHVMYIGQTLGFNVIPIKIDHGTVMFVKGDEKYEITTLRQDILSDGRWAKIRATRSWLQDAQRRDFTINALYMDGAGKIYDYVGGLSDIKNKILRFVGDPIRRIQEDYLRIIRLFRFWAHYVRPADEGIAACAEMRDGLAKISRERILAEMLKLYSAPDPWSSIQSMWANSIIVNNNGSQLSSLEAKYNIKFSPLSRLALTTDITSWPISRQQKTWITALNQKAESLGDILEKYHQYGKNFAHDYALLYQPELLRNLPSTIISCPVLPNELPVPPGPEMGIRYKALHKWWCRQLIPPTKADCIEWYEREYNQLL